MSRTPENDFSDAVCVLDLSEGEVETLGGLEAELKTMAGPVLEAAAVQFINQHSRAVEILNHAALAAELATGTEAHPRAAELVKRLRHSEFQTRTAVMIARDELRRRYEFPATRH